MGIVQLRASIAAAGARLGAHGLVVGTEGNISVRIDRAHILVTPRGRRKDELRPEDLLVIPLDRDGGTSASPGDARPSSDIEIHRAIYRVRPDVDAIVHAHVPSAMALTLVGEMPDPAILPETALLLPRLPLVPFGVPGSAELARDVAAALATGPEPFPGAVLLERHGAIAVAASLEQAVDRMDLVDVLCRVWRDARLLAPDRMPTQRGGDPAA